MVFRSRLFRFRGLVLAFFLFPDAERLFRLSLWSSVTWTWIYHVVTSDVWATKLRSAPPVAGDADASHPSRSFEDLKSSRDTTILAEKEVHDFRGFLGGAIPARRRLRFLY